MSDRAKFRPVLVKRYARRRLYDTTHRCYVSVEQLRGWAASGVAFTVIDVETGADITVVLLS
jgi:polyhydroxyalkanoate synthesis regulator protein